MIKPEHILSDTDDIPQIKVPGERRKRKARFTHKIYSAEERRSIKKRERVRRRRGRR